MGTSLPRECGIATFTKDLAFALKGLRIVGECFQVAVDRPETNNVYSSNMKYVIDQDDVNSYREAAHLINKSNIDVVNLQHEFGIFGGELGEYIMEFCAQLQKPLVTTFHTVLPNPPLKVRKIMDVLIDWSKVVVVALDSASRILVEQYGMDETWIRVIPHGAPVCSTLRPDVAKARLGFTDKIVISTFGLISSGKGIEFGIQALSCLVDKFPNIVYLIIGKTHPEVKKREGEAYRESLLARADSLGLRNKVMFVNEFLPDEIIAKYFQATDIYLAPYRGRDQVSSGSITLALGFGKAIVSTPTIFALETLSQKRGLLCKFEDGKSIVECIDALISDPMLMKTCKSKAYEYGRRMVWDRVAKEYGKVYRLASEFRKPIVEVA